MGMTVNISVVSNSVKGSDIERIFSYFRHIDERFSLYKDTSEITKINLGLVDFLHISDEMRNVFNLAELTKKETGGYFNIEKDFRIDPSGIVKGYAISEGANILRQMGFNDFFIEIAGDIETSGLNEVGKKWKVGIQNPFNPNEIIKALNVSDNGIATSGNYRRGRHIYNPHTGKMADMIESITVVAKSAYEADRFATAAFAMGEKGLEFLEQKDGLEGYMVTKDKRGSFTSGFEKYTLN